MNTEEKKPHSAEYFGEQRNFWWNSDFLRLMATRLEFSRATKLLDVGCGIGHWGHVLSPMFSEEASIVGVDPEATWISEAKARAEKLGLSKI